MVIVVEPAVGYLIAALKAQYPRAKTVAIHFHPQLRTHAEWHADYCWHSKLEISLTRFLTHTIADLPSPRIAIITPPYAHYLIPKELAEFRRLISEILTAVRSNIATVGYFGRQWIRNSIANFLFHNRALRIQKFAGLTVAIVGSGPTLHSSITLLTRIARHVLICALPSALAFLDAHGMTPDFIINTDGGFWATTHLRKLSRSAPRRIVMPLTAARELYRQEPAILFINQEFCLEADLYKELRSTMPTFSSRGTVASTAVEFATHMCAEQIVLFGIDGAYINGALHCHPHSFEHYYHARASLLSPSDTILAGRLIDAAPTDDTATIRTAHSHTLYRKEIQELIQESPIPISFVRPSAVMASMATMEDKEAQELCIGQPPIDKERLFTEENARMSRERKLSILSSLLKRYQEEIALTTPKDIAARSDLRELMHALRAQEFHTFWKTEERRHWHLLQKECINDLSTLRARYHV